LPPSATVRLHLTRRQAFHLPARLLAIHRTIRSIVRVSLAIRTEGGMTDSPDQVAEYIWAIAMLLEMHARQAGLDSAAHLLAQVVQNASEVLAQHRAATPLLPEIASG